MRRVCLYHAGCPDGFGAAWAVWRSWGASGHYEARGHDDALDAAAFSGAEVVWVDIAPQNHHLRSLLHVAARVVVLDHHVSSQGRYQSDPELADAVARGGHHVCFDLEHSGAALAWRHFHPGQELPDLIAYVEDQDLWTWKLPRSREVNAAISVAPYAFEAWDEMASRPASDLADEGAPVVRAQQREIERAARAAHPVWLGSHRVEAVNAVAQRAWIGHELATRAAFGVPCAAVYRLAGDRVDVSVYSVGDFDVAALAAERGGGGHRSAAGFSVPLETWLREYL